MVPGCAGFLDLRAAGGFTSQLGIQAGRSASGLESPEELKSPHLGQSQSCKRLGLTLGLPRPESWTRSSQSLLTLLELEVGFLTERCREPWHS